MSASRRMINLIGTLLVLVALVAGTMLTALPIYFESVELNTQERNVAQSNQLLKTQIDGLRAQEAQMPQVERELTALHNQLPGIPQLDDATQLVVKAASTAKATIENIDFGDVAPFGARDAATVFEQLPQTATEVAPSTESTGNGTEGSEAVTDDTDNGKKPKRDVETETTAPGTAEQLQFPVAITVIVSDPTAASRFLDELRAGPRLLQIDTATATTGDDGLALTVVGLVFVSRTN